MIFFFVGNRVQFEKDCGHIQSTMKDFLAWINHTLVEDHPLKEYSTEEYFAYADYMHLPELLGDDGHPLINVGIFDHFAEREESRILDDQLVRDGFERSDRKRIDTMDWFARCSYTMSL